MIYFDNAATTLPKPNGVVDAVAKAMCECGNAGRSAHPAAVQSAETLYRCREAVGKMFGQDNPENVVFTLNTTHALNLAIKSVLGDGGHCVISGYEHNSVVRPLHAMRQIGVTFTAVKTPLFAPEIFLEEFEKSIRSDTVCAICMHVSNVFGYILPIEEVDKICAKYGVKLIVDAAQSAGSIPIDFKRFSALSSLCIPGHKGLLGPQGTGVMICGDEVFWKPLLEGGTGSNSRLLEQPDFLPDRLEAGTQNVHGIAGLAAGVEYVCALGEKVIFHHERELIRYATEELKRFSRFRVFCGEEQAGVLSFLDERVSAEEIADFLGENGIAVRGGLHCAPLAHQTVGTLGGCVRISVSPFNRFGEIETLCDVLKKL